MQDVYSAFVGSFGLNVRMMREMCQVRRVEIRPKPGSLLHLPAAPHASFLLPLDYVIAPLVIVTHCWDAETVRLASGIVKARNGDVTLVDIGANSGLFTRQMLGACPEFRHAFAYEPHPDNYECLRHNLSAFDQVRTRHYALGPDAGSLEFHLDPDNCGNYSLNASAMPAGRECARISVPVQSAEAETLDWLAPGLPIFYKSDTQGHDEIIATSIGIAFWDHVFAGIFELWRIGKPSWSADTMGRLLNRFPHKRFLRDPNTPVSTSDILAYLAGGDGAFPTGRDGASPAGGDGASNDVLFWK